MNIILTELSPMSGLFTLDGNESNRSSNPMLTNAYIFFFHVRVLGKPEGIRKLLSFGYIITKEFSHVLHTVRFECHFDTCRPVMVNEHWTYTSVAEHVLSPGPVDSDSSGINKALNLAAQLGLLLKARQMNSHEDCGMLSIIISITT